MIETLKQALAALELIERDGNTPGFCEFDTNEDALKYHAAFEAGNIAIRTLRELIQQLEDNKPVVEYQNRRGVPTGTRECWGFLLEGQEELPRGTKLYAYPVQQK